MRRFIVERYLPGMDPAEVRAMLERIAALAESMRERSVTYRRSVVYARDESVFCEFEAEALEDVRRANEEAGLPVDRVVEIEVAVPEADMTR
jgi:hypothetical protein